MCVSGFMCQKVNSIGMIRWFVRVQTLCLCLHTLSVSRLLLFVKATRSAMNLYSAVVLVIFFGVVY